jgi:CheY-like chemotaxis protein
VGPTPGHAFDAVLLLPTARTRTILVVDDNPDLAYLFSRFLRGHDYHVLEAATGETALRIAREARPDAITLDVLMPSQDGWDILRDLASDPSTRQIPIILCSVLPERSLALSLGVAEFLNKPVTQEALLSALRRCA